MSYFDEFDPDNMPKTPMEVITLMITQLQEVSSELDYLSTEEFIRLPCDKRGEAWRTARKLLKELTRDQNELMSLTIKMFERAYFDATDLTDRLNRAHADTTAK